MAIAQAFASFDAADEASVAASLTRLTEAVGQPLVSAELAAALDAEAPLAASRANFHVPRHSAELEQAYFAGNSLGLPPKATAVAVNAELDKWGSRGVNGHFEGALPWATCEDAVPPLMAELVGARDAKLEVGAMNSLTVNLHMLMAAFYRPTDGRAAIIMEAGAFPSDRYAVGSQIVHHGRDPKEWMIEVQPRADSLLHTEDILAAIDANRDRCALVLLGGVNYLTGQVLDMGAIAAHMRKLNSEAKAAGRPPIPFGLDLAHAVGNVPLSLHDWGVDFAAWCTYKYLNSGAGCLAGLFVHEEHARDSATYPRLSGWWGVPFSSRFQMAHAYEEAAGAAGFGVSNVNPLMVACVHASLTVVYAAGGIHKLRAKSVVLTSYLAALLEARGLLGPPSAGALGSIELVTPADPACRGCQLSLRVVPAPAAAGPPLTMRALEAKLLENGVVCDAREPDVIRLAPVPLYNTFVDCHRAVEALVGCLTGK